MRIDMTNIGEIIMFSVEPKEVVCARFVQHALGDVCVDGAGFETRNGARRKHSRSLYDSVVSLLAGYDFEDRFRFNACSGWFGAAG